MNKTRVNHVSVVAPKGIEKRASVYFHPTKSGSTVRKDTNGINMFIE
ncbi:hypothetical protein PspKH34_22800 [Parageobacillus sp. KH3-4]|nr:hypothetical protein PspKH34_22800 [Parageobacillus sp. KH3-4]